MAKGLSEPAMSESYLSSVKRDNTKKKRSEVAFSLQLKCHAAWRRFPYRLISE